MTLYYGHDTPLCHDPFHKLETVQKRYPKTMEDRLHPISKKTGQYPTLSSIYRKGMSLFVVFVKERKEGNLFRLLLDNRSTI